jgi:muramoyltetrapeptide carboxypeptidase
VPDDRDGDDAGESSRLSRRGWLRAGAALAAGSLATTQARASGDCDERSSAVYPPALQLGDRVRIVAPARPGDERLARGVDVLESFGLLVELADHVFDQYGYLAGSDADRLADLNAAFRDPGVRAVVGARGGYGSQRIIDGLDVDAIRHDPKVFLGFSDLTSVHCKLWRAARLVSLYGPLANWADARTGPDSIESMRKALMSVEPIVLTRDLAEPSAQVVIMGNDTGVASGPLLGGNLTLLQTAIGTGDVPSLEGAIFLFEDTGEAPYSYDRMLTQLLRIGALDGIAGVAIGQFNDAVGAPDEWTAAQVVRERLEGLGVPVLGGLRIGHGNGQLTVPLGARATLDIEAGTLSVEAGVR